MLETTDEPPQQPMRLLAAVSVNGDLDELEAERSAGNERKGRVLVVVGEGSCSVLISKGNTAQLCLRGGGDPWEMPMALPL